MSSEAVENKAKEIKSTPKKAEDNHDEHDPYYAPIISLPKQVIPTMEEDEDVIFKSRAKLYRFDKDADPPEWKERGLGDVKLLKHTNHGRVRVLMRREKVHKLCANHYIQIYMKLQEQGEKTWVWRVIHEYADGEPKDETLAIRFKTAEIANQFKSKFEDVQKEMSEKEENEAKTAESSAQNEEENTAKDDNEESTEVVKNGTEKEENVEQATEELNKLNVKENTEAATETEQKQDCTN